MVMFSLDTTGDPKSIPKMSGLFKNKIFCTINIFLRRR